MLEDDGCLLDASPVFIKVDEDFGPLIDFIFFLFFNQHWLVDIDFENNFIVSTIVI